MQAVQLSPVEYHNRIYLKRNDLIEYAGCFGGKAECIYNFISQSPIKSFVTCGSRDSLQCDIVSEICEYLGYKCHIFIPLGKDTPTIKRMENRQYTTLYKVDKGYTVVLKSRATKFAIKNHLTYIPFGMEHSSSVNIISKQVVNIPETIKRVIVPVGGGITLCGVLKGLQDIERTDIEVIGVMAGGKPDKLLKGFPTAIRYKLLPYKEDTPPLKMYSMRTDYEINGIKLDPIYEGKCYPFLQANDLLWIVGYHEVD